MKPTKLKVKLLLGAAVLFTSVFAYSYSVLTHEEIIDILWLDRIRPLLLQRFPQASAEELKEAHAYAYGGAVIQDLGYYPFGSKTFSDLVHYVRSGDFVVELIQQSKDLNEFAFALGALSHYASDIDGHPAVNQAVALEYPKLRKKFGPVVTYAQDRAAHLQTEFSFDVIQVAKQRYAPEQYHDFIGFKVSKPLLERTFPIIYGIPLGDVLTKEDLAIGSYRFAVSGLIPKMTKVAVALKGTDPVPEKNNTAKQKFIYHISRADYEREWGKEYQKPGIGARILAFFFRLIPKVGPLKFLGFKKPTAQTQDLYFKSIDATIHDYRSHLEQVHNKNFHLPNKNFDTGHATAPAEYSLTDDAYAKLLIELEDNHFEQVPRPLKTNILQFFSDPDAPLATKKDTKKWTEAQSDLQQLRSTQPIPESAVSQPESK